MAKRVAGICYIKVDGTQLEVSGSVETPLAPTKKEAVLGLAGVAGYKETAIAPYIKLAAVFTPDFPLDKITKSTAMTVTAELANGKVYTLSESWLEGEPAAKGDDGTTDLEFKGLKGIWQ